MTEIVLMWAAVTLYAISSILFIFGAVFQKQRLVDGAFWVVLAGFVLHTAAIALRWAAVGHAPILGFYEAVSGLAWAAVVALIAASWRNKPLRVLGVILAPAAVLMLGGAMLAPHSPLRLTAKLASYWLNIHVAFAKLCFMSFIAAFAISIVYLYRDSKGERPGSMLSRLPDQAVLDDLSFRFVAVGFIFLTVMIVAGAIWANEAWGRYWAWDPIETWSLISWIVYAGYLHARLTLGWRGRKSAWYAIIALVIMAFTLVGVPLAYHSIHSVYLKGY